MMKTEAQSVFYLRGTFYVEAAGLFSVSNIISNIICLLYSAATAFSACISNVKQGDKEL